MQINNETSYMVEAIPLTGPEEKYFLTIIVKGTFNIHPDDYIAISNEQMPVFFGDELYDPESGGSVKFETDVVPFKPRADIAMVGSAYSPGGEASQFVDVSLRVGNIMKKLRVIGDRKWKYLGRFLPVISSKPNPFTIMDLVYERSFGGVDQEGGGFCDANLVGCGYYGKKKKSILDGAALPNIEDPNNLIKSWKDHPNPVGFAFYGKGWAPRAQYLGTYDETWRKERSPKPPIDFSFKYYNSAHPDLQFPGYLKGNEDVELVNLTKNGYLYFKLLKTDIQCSATKVFGLSLPPANGEEHRFMESVKMNIDTFCLIPDEKKLYMVWRGLCPINDLTALEVKAVNIKETGQAPV